MNKLRKADYEQKAMRLTLAMYGLVLTLFHLGVFLYFGHIDRDVLFGSIPTYLVCAWFTWLSYYNRLTRGLFKDKNGEILYPRDWVLIYGDRDRENFYGHIVYIEDNHAMVNVELVDYEFSRMFSLGLLAYESEPKDVVDQLMIEFDTEVRGDTLVVTSPGKFEGEPLYVVYFYRKAMIGQATDSIYTDESPFDYFELDENDKALFPELEHERYIGIWTSQQGFVYTEDTEQVEAFIKQQNEGQDLDRDFGLAA